MDYTNILPIGTAVKVLEAYVTNKRHYVEATSGMMSGKKGYSKIWFNSKECYIQTKYLKSFKATPNGSGIAKLGAPIGVMVIDSPWRANGEATYSATGLEALKKYKNASWKERSSSKLPSSIKMVENDWANVYKTEEYNYVEQGVSVSQEKTATIYTVVFGGEVRYVFDDGRAPGFTYYHGNGYSKQTTANTQKIYVDLNAYDVLAYNINGNNYFKLRDVTDALDCRVEWNSRNNMINIITTLPEKEDPNEAKG